MELKSMLFYETLRFFFGPLFSLRLHLKVEGKRNVPEEGGVLIVANHRCYLDPFVLACSIERFINFGAGSHLYLVPGTRKIFELAGFFPVHIYGGPEGDRSQDEACRILSRGELVCIFPEGIESFMRIGEALKISEFKTGFVKIALESRVPVLPVAIIPGYEKEFPAIPSLFIKPFVRHPKVGEGVRLITYRDVTCRIGIPVDLSPFYEETLSKDLLDRIASRVRRIVVSLYEGKDLNVFLYGEMPFDIASDFT